LYHRRIIRDSSKLNELLYYNNNWLNFLYDEHKKEHDGLFDKKAAFNFFKKYMGGNML
jgi:hypothetical protein